MSDYRHIDPGLLDRLLVEGRRIRKVPWCAVGDAEWDAAEILKYYGITEQETMEETLARRKIENGY